MQISFDIERILQNKHVLVIEDIADTCLTLKAIQEHLIKAKKPRSLCVCALLYKPERQKVRVRIDFLGFTIPDKFVVGYGIDYASRYRELPFIGYLV